MYVGERREKPRWGTVAGAPRPSLPMKEATSNIAVSKKPKIKAPAVKLIAMS